MVFRLVYSLIRVPRLFVYLFLFPLLLSLVLVVGQILVTHFLIASSNFASSSIPEEDVELVNPDRELASRVLFMGKEPKQVIICSWQEIVLDDGRMVEVPPNESCQPDRLDVAFRSQNFGNKDLSEYKRLFDGLVERIHLCKSCQPDIVVSKESDGSIRTTVFSAWGLLIARLFEADPDLHNLFIEIKRERLKVQTLLGEIRYEVEGLQEPILISELFLSLTLIFNVLILLIVMMWLALKGHRRVLEYFTRNGALLPMVAATGKKTFYGAMWILTGLRVSFFLLASVPLTYFGFHGYLQEVGDIFFKGDLSAWAVWLLAVVSSLSLTLMIASMSDLRQRHEAMSFIYKYIPLVLAFIGMFIWTLSFFLESSQLVRDIIIAIPVVGMGPLFVAPIVKPSDNFLVLHALLSAGLLLVIIKNNVQWFSAHLEEL